MRLAIAIHTSTPSPSRQLERAQPLGNVNRCAVSVLLHNHVRCRPQPSVAHNHETIIITMLTSPTPVMSTGITTRADEYASTVCPVCSAAVAGQVARRQLVAGARKNEAGFI
jgi:hypothetical protein